jgi:hypothetical protein
MDDKEIGRLWAEYYPKSKDNRDAFQLCWVICRLIREKSSFVLAIRRSIRLRHVLDDCGVPKAEFDEIEKGGV